MQESHVIVLGTRVDDKVQFVAAVSRTCRNENFMLETSFEKLLPELAAVSVDVQTWLRPEAKIQVNSNQLSMQ